MSASVPVCLGAYINELRCAYPNIEKHSQRAGQMHAASDRLTCNCLHPAYAGSNNADCSTCRYASWWGMLFQIQVTHGLQGVSVCCMGRRDVPVPEVSEEGGGAGQGADLAVQIRKSEQS